MGRRLPFIECFVDEWEEKNADRVAIGLFLSICSSEVPHGVADPGDETVPHPSDALFLSDGWESESSMDDGLFC